MLPFEQWLAKRLPAKSDAAYARRLTLLSGVAVEKPPYGREGNRHERRCFHALWVAFLRAEKIALAVLRRKHERLVEREEAK